MGLQNNGLEWMMKDFALTWHWVIGYICCILIRLQCSVKSHHCKITNRPWQLDRWVHSGSFRLNQIQSAWQKNASDAFNLFCDPVCGSSIEHEVKALKEITLFSITHYCARDTRVMLTCARWLWYPAQRTNLAQLKRSPYFMAAVCQHVDHIHRK